ncbi:MAG: hypothetical protein JWP89_102 [Schlesneria sp.]|nr:hypothetical protein [Schlesneria sp.]
MQFVDVRLFSSLFIVGCATAAIGAETDRFADSVAPILEQRCVRCHSTEKPRGGLSFSSRESTLTGGDSGPVIVAGRPDESLLIEMVAGIKPQMPAEGIPLTKAEVDRLRNWIKSGAVWPDGVTLQERQADGRLWWSYQPIQRPTVPGVNKSSWVRNPIDRFVLAKLEASDLQPSAEADRRTLIRRLSFDLLGLPPTPNEIDEFAKSRDPNAYEELVDRFLDSPHYGERWARHWLDIAHYADTHGFERDQRRDNAWHYRDWVIRALNADKRYDDFLRDQLAGDVLRPNDSDAVIATGFLTAGPWDFVGQVETPSPVLKRLARADDLDDMVTQVMTAACGVTINCARCHDHKLDPISQREYYGLWAVFAGVKRADRDVSPSEVKELAERRQRLNTELQQIRISLARLNDQGRDLADIVGGGDGFGTGTLGQGIDPVTGNAQLLKRGLLEGAKPNLFAKSSVKFIDGVVIPDLSPEGTQITSTGLRLMNVPRTSGQTWDAIRFGPINSFFSTKLDGVDYANGDHTLLSLHANAAITFDLAALRDAGAPSEMKFTATAGYFGQTPRHGASFQVFVDGDLKVDRVNIGRDDGSSAIDLILPESARFLTLMSTDGGNGIGHDQICFADARLVAPQRPSLSDLEKQEVVRLQQRRIDVQREIGSLPSPQRVYATVAEAPPAITILKRGDPEQIGDQVAPAALACVRGLNPELGSAQSSDADRRQAFAEWIASEANPLTRRVIVNRLWHHHFGMGLVETPSDFGIGGSLPSHPELLDWLADELLAQKWSLKSMHRLICTSASYRQQSAAVRETSPDSVNRAVQVDAGNRLLWRMNARRLDAESVRDATLLVSGKLNPEMFGPGYRDFEYQEEYAPVYRYITPDSPDLWRRSVYRFAVRTTSHQFLTTLDCPSAANLVPVRNTTTTALQSLALLNNDFMLRQSEYFAQRIKADAGDDLQIPVTQAFRFAFGRDPTDSEQDASVKLAQSRGLLQLCRMLLNANEFVYVD